MRIVLGFIAASILLVASLAAYVLHTSSIEDLLICSSSDSGIYIPAPVCETYLRQFRATPESVGELEQSSGIAFAFGLDGPEFRMRILDFLVSNGASVTEPSKIDGLPPLHAAVVLNDASVVEFLLEHGASPAQEDAAGRTATELLATLEERQTSTDREAVRSLLAAPAE